MDMTKAANDRNSPPPGSAPGSVSVLIADRNPHVRAFLRREMAAGGHRARVAVNAHELLQCLKGAEPVDLVLLDPDLPGMHEGPVLAALQSRTPHRTVIVHTFLSVYVDWAEKLPGAIFIEKNASSVEQIHKVLGRCTRSPR